MTAKACGQTAAGPCPSHGEYHRCNYRAPGHARHICVCGQWWYGDSGHRAPRPWPVSPMALFVTGVFLLAAAGFVAVIAGVVF